MTETRESYQCDLCGISYTTNVHQYLEDFKQSHETGYNHMMKLGAKP